MSYSPVSDTSSDLYAEEELPPHGVSATRSEHGPAQLTPPSDSTYEDSPLSVQDQHVQPTAAPLADQPAQHPPAKRRLDSEETEPEPVKRQKVLYTATAEKYFSPTIPSVADAPAEIWQHIFLYFPPDTLSRCLRVNRAFNMYLTRLNTSMSVRLPLRRTGVKVMDSEAIWTSSRKFFAPNLPRPLSGFSEMQMIQLLGGKACLNCKVLPTHPLDATNQWTAGPGANSVRVIWSFYTRLCGPCFEHLTLKDVQVLVSPAAPLRAGLLHAFRTNDLHYIPPTTLQANPAGAPKGTLSKVYFRKNIDDLQGQYKDAQELGDAAAEEWVKGLPSAGKLQSADTARWERWEALHPPGSDLAKVLREYFRPCSSVPLVEEVQPKHVPHSGGSLPAPPTSLKYPLPQRPAYQELPQPEQASSIMTTSSALYAPGTAPSHSSSVLYPPGTAPSHSSSISYPPGMAPPHSATVTHQQAWRVPRTMQEATEAKAARRADIERRCQQEFHPPLMPPVLQHMECFHAAMQITNPLTDQAWEMLKSRLLTQRDVAERLTQIAMEEEWQRAEQMRALQASIPDNTWRDSLSKNAHEAADRQWEAAQAPIRKKLGAYADSFIMAKYPDRVKENSCSKFAVEVLLYSRNQYVEANKPEIEVQYENPATEAPDFVSLENMRWLFDEKVKPVVDRVMGERYSKELFCCADCPGSKKGYAFEGLMQHFGAKHTDDFTRGNIVVHWQTAEWPQDPPFVIGAADPTMPELPKSRRSGFDRKPPLSYDPASATSNGAAWLDNQHESNHATPIATAYPEHSSTVHPTYGHGVEPTYGSVQVPAQQAQLSYQTGYVPAPTTTSVQTTQTSLVDMISGQSHEVELNEIAKVARDVWDSTAGVKDLLDCVRVQTVLYHITSTFKARFGRTPTLDLLAETLTDHILMRPLKNASGIACRTCVSYNLDGDMAFASYQKRVAKTKLYNLSSLIAHFKAVHLQSQDAGSYDWKADMVELPDDDDIRGLVTTVGMDGDKLATIAKAFPEVFPNPLPRVGLVNESDSALKTLDSRRASQHDFKKNKKQKRNSSHRGNVWEQDDTQGEQSDNLPEPAEDEYDPRRPAFVEFAHSRTFSNSRRSLGDAQRTAASSIDLSGLNPATIAALANLNIPISSLAGPRKPERTPSIPRVGAMSATLHQALNPADPYLRETAEAHNGRDSGDGGRRRSGKRRRVAESESPEQDYTQIIRTPATGSYEQQTLSAHPGLVQPVRPSLPPRFDQYGRTVEHRIEPALYPVPEAPSHPARVEYRDQWGRPCDVDGRPLVAAAHQPLRPIYVDEYGREVQVIERPAAVHDYAPTPAPLSHHRVGTYAPGHPPPSFERPPPGFEQRPPPGFERPSPVFERPPPGFTAYDNSHRHAYYDQAPSPSQPPIGYYDYQPAPGQLLPPGYYHPRNPSGSEHGPPPSSPHFRYENGGGSAGRHA